MVASLHVVVLTGTMQKSLMLTLSYGFCGVKLSLDVDNAGQGGKLNLWLCFLLALLVLIK